MYPGNIKIRLPDSHTIKLVLVTGGDYDMGGDQYDDEKPVHRVRVSSFYMGKYPVTQEIWKVVMKTNPSEFKGDNRPVERVSWDDTQKFFRKLNEMGWTSEAGISGNFRLPTEAEWEYAARGGVLAQGYLYAGSDRLKQVGWYDENSNDETHQPGLLMANELGLYDMSGNVLEWCEDWYATNYYEKCMAEGLVIDPPGTERGDDRVLRGGGYFDSAGHCRVAYRGRFAAVNRFDFIGFRVLLHFRNI